MRIRTIKPEFWTDSTMVSLPRDVRLFFVGLWNVADDFGYFRDDADQLKLQIFPGDSDIDVSELLEVLIASGRIDRFEDSEGVRFLKIAKWEDHQRVDKPTKSKIAREDSRKLAIPLSTRREVALKYGCTPGGEVSASCYFCGAPGRIVWWKLSSGKPSSWVIFPDLELDHFIPESQSGEGSEGNIVLSCRFCNRSRGNKSAIEFLANPRESSRILAPERKGKERKVKEEESLRSLCEGSHLEGEADPLLDPLSIESRFEAARKQFPGRKLGFAVEFQNFVKKVGGRSKAAAEVDRLLPGIEAEKADREKKTAAGAFVPEWKNFKTWINAKAWEQEFAATGSSPAPKAASNRQAEREAKLRSGFALAAKLKESAGISAPVLPLEVEK